MKTFIISIFDKSYPEASKLHIVECFMRDFTNMDAAKNWVEELLRGTWYSYTHEKTIDTNYNLKYIIEEPHVFHKA